MTNALFPHDVNLLGGIAIGVVVVLALYSFFDRDPGGSPPMLDPTVPQPIVTAWQDASAAKAKAAGTGKALAELLAAAQKAQAEHDLARAELAAKYQALRTAEDQHFQAAAPVAAPQSPS